MHIYGATCFPCELALAVPEHTEGEALQMLLERHREKHELPSVGLEAFPCSIDWEITEVTVTPPVGSRAYHPYRAG